ncbi:MAG: fasciclin domain-containing protein, partial [Bacteroidales bacterium]
IITGSEVHTTLAVAVTEAGLVEALSAEGPFTVFAPTDDAFAALPEGLLETLLEDPSGMLTDILLYHVVSGSAYSGDLSDGQSVSTLFGQDVTVTINEEGVFINNARVVIADLEADNGVVHVIDAVLVPAEEPTTVVDIITGSEVHTTLAVAVTEAGLVEALSAEGPFTVFAPTDDAFAALPEGLLETLLEDPSGMLTDILLYHVVSGSAYSGDLSDGQSVSTLFGQDVTVTINEEGVFINNARVVIADLEADNGVVHVIDAVLVPAEEPTTNVNTPIGSTGIEVSVYPNPARNFFNIEFQSGASERVSLEIYSMIGNRVAYRDLGIIPAGYHSYNQMIEGFHQGIYFIVLNLGNERVVNKLQVTQ